MGKLKKIKFNLPRLLNTGIIGPLIGFGIFTSLLLLIALLYFPQI